MKKVMMSMAALVLVTMFGCQSSSPRGGGMTKDVGFRIAVPIFTTEIKQGEVQSVIVTLTRGDYFKQDVKLQIEASKGISVDPTSVTVKASDRPDVQVKIAAAQDTAIGEYNVRVVGTPKTGEPTSTVFNVKVVAP